MRNTILPTYVVIDLSESMSWHVSTSDNRTRITVAKEIIPTLINSMEDGSVADSLRVRVIGFNNGIAFYTDLMEGEQLPNWYKNNADKSFRCIGQTWYGTAFDKLRECIDKDINNALAKGETYFRPLVYFLTDGKPEGEDASVREKRYKALVSNPDERRNPVIFCIGIGEADMSILKKYGASRYKSKDGKYRTNNSDMTFVPEVGVDVRAALTKLNNAIILTIKNSLQNRASNTKYEIDFGALNDLFSGDVRQQTERLFRVDTGRSLGSIRNIPR